MTKTKFILLLIVLLMPLTGNAVKNSQGALETQKDVAAETAAAIKLAIAADPDQAATSAAVAAIVSRAVLANPDQAAAIVAAAIAVDSRFAIAITNAAIAAAPNNAAAIAAAASAAAPDQKAAINAAAVSTLLTWQGANNPSFNTSESVVNSNAMTVDVAVNAINNCTTPACVANVYAQVANSSSNSAGIVQQIHEQVQVSPN